jgi:hypothetical protein
MHTSKEEETEEKEVPLQCSGPCRTPNTTNTTLEV